MGNNMKNFRNNKGFTLVELMITVLVVGILASIAFPSYKEYMRKSKRAEARSALMQASMNMERYFSSNNIYSGATAGTVFPSSSASNNYSISIASVDDQTYSLVATPLQGQADDPCGKLLLNQAGQKSVTGTLSSDKCWGIN
jgi:type IV pilus assembly protein PilE